MVSSTIRGLLFSLPLIAYPLPQHAFQRPAQAATEDLGRVSLNEASAVEVPSLPAESIVAPLSCDSEGRILFRLAMPDTGVEDPVSVSPDGQTVVRFGREKISDIPQPALSRMFLAGTDVYILARGRLPLGYETKWRTPSGDVQTQQASRTSTFVAHFRRDGTYVAAVPLDLPFTPQQLGVFENGDFLLAGVDKSRSEPRVAIVGPNGQIRRFVELEGDVHTERGGGTASKDKDSGALPRFKSSQDAQESFFDVVSTSQIVKDGPNLLLFRPLDRPIFSISPSGEVRAHRLKIQGNYRLFTIKPSRNVWIVELIRDLPRSAAQEFSTYAFDPETGALLREYLFPKNLGWGLACTDGNEFTFVEADEKKNALRLVTFAPPANSN